MVSEIYRLPQATCTIAMIDDFLLHFRRPTLIERLEPWWVELHLCRDFHRTLEDEHP